jgi:hypothetical protein
MKKVMLTLLILTLAAISQAELLTDAGFEEGAWPVTGNYGYYYAWANSETDPAVARTGSGYLATGNWASWASWGYSVAWEWIPAVEGETYTLSAWFKDAWGGIGTAGTVSTVLKMEWRDIDGIATGPEDVASPQEISRDWTAGPGADGWQQKTITAVAPTGTVRVVAVIGEVGGQTSMWTDDASLTNTQTKAVAPDPTVGDTVGHLLQTDLSWRHGSNTATFDVYLRADTDANNIVAGDLIAGGISVQTAPVTLANNTDYVWRVDSTDGATTPGDAWSFATGDVPPVADAGSDQYLWGAPLTGINLDGAITDDGNSAVTYLWDLTQGISGFVTIDSPTSLNTTVDITQKGEYIFRLTATDASGSGSDTVLVSITDDACTAAIADPTDYTTPFAGDISGDCVVGIDDLKLLALDWLGCIGCTP